MRTLPLLVLPLPPSVFPHQPRTHVSDHVLHQPALSFCCSVNNNCSSSSRNKGVVFGVNRSGSESSSSSKERLFLDENGVVDDMEGYLNHLSLEYDSVWDTKPSWCQPWTIMLTGVSIIAISWLILHSVLATSVISSLIFAWWYIFLYSYPKAYSDMIAERRERVTNGVEDTFGRRKQQ